MCDVDGVGAVVITVGCGVGMLGVCIDMVTDAAVGRCVGVVIRCNSGVVTSVITFDGVITRSVVVAVGMHVDVGIDVGVVYSGGVDAYMCAVIEDVVGVVDCTAAVVVGPWLCG